MSEDRENPVLRKFLTILFVSFLLSLIPFSTVVVPKWKIRIVDTAGTTCVGRQVNTTWQHYSILTDSGHEETRQTNSDGYVEFPERTIKTPLIVRVISAVIANVLTITHGSAGIHVTLDTPDMVDKSQAYLGWKPGEPLIQEIVVESCKQTSHYYRGIVD